MSQPEQEGVIKYELDFHAAEPRDYPQCAELNSWRMILWRLALIGQDPARYGGLGFGNISFRLANSLSFVITGSQTGTLTQLDNTDLSTVLSADTGQNYLAAEGKLKPSSEALTHAAVYQASKSVQAVVHVHSPDIWRHYSALNLAATAPEIPYGTPNMADAVQQLIASNRLSKHPVFVMLGHEDGVVAFGKSIAEASLALISLFADALKITCSMPERPQGKK